VKRRRKPYAWQEPVRLIERSVKAKALLPKVEAALGHAATKRAWRYEQFPEEPELSRKLPPVEMFHSVKLRPQLTKELATLDISEKIVRT
jgi:hypothetical protein